jgi:hypothetical protein
MFASGERITKPFGLAKDQMSFSGTVVDGTGNRRQLNDLLPFSVWRAISSAARPRNSGIRLGHGASRQFDSIRDEFGATGFYGS